MNRYLTTIITFIIFSNFSIGQSIKIFEGKKILGAIFPSSYKNTAYNWLDESKRFTPTDDDVLQFESDLRYKLKKINKNRWNQHGDCPLIHNNLNRYVRQYLGFIDDSGKKYLLINFLWKTSSLHENAEQEYYNEEGDWKKNWQIWFDGCSHFWNVKYYLQSDILFDLQINGSS